MSKSTYSKPRTLATTPCGLFPNRESTENLREDINENKNEKTKKKKKKRKSAK